MLFYAFKMVGSIVSLCVNASDYICTQPDLTLFFSNLYGRAPWGPKGVKKSDFFLQIKVLSSCPFGSKNIKNRVFRFDFISVHLPLC